MEIKKIWVCTVFLFVLIPVTAYSQTGLYDLQQGGMAIGVGVSGLDFRSQDAFGIGGNLSYGINNQTKIVLTANMGIVDSDRYGSEFDVPLPVAIGVGPVHVGALGQTGLNYFLAGAFYRGYSSGISRPLDAPADPTLLSVRTNGFSSGGGISKRLETNFGWFLNPFCGVSYSRSWTRVSREEEPKIRRNRVSSYFRGRIGLEIEVAPMVSVVGTFGILLEDFDSSFSIGLNFH